MWRWEVNRSEWGWLWRETRRTRSSGPPAPAVAPVRMGEPPWSTDHRGKLPGRRQKENCPVPRPSLYNRWGNIGHHGISKHQSGNGRKYQCNKNQQVLRNVTICQDISRSCLVSHQNWRHLISRFLMPLLPIWWQQLPLLFFTFHQYFIISDCVLWRGTEETI